MARTCTFLNPHNVVCCTECGSDLSLCECVDLDGQAWDRLTSPDGLAMRMILDELKAARVASPGTTHLLVTLVKEVGALAQGMMEHDRAQGISVNEVLRKAIQVAATTVRVAIEGDENFLYEFPVVEDELPRGPVGSRYD